MAFIKCHTLIAEADLILIIYIAMHMCHIFSGAWYPDMTAKEETLDDAVAPGKMHNYMWTLSPSHAPGKDDTNCLTRVYHSHVNAPKDTASGLIGPLIICKKGLLTCVVNLKQLHGNRVVHIFIRLIIIYPAKLNFCHLEEYCF